MGKRIRRHQHGKAAQRGGRQKEGEPRKNRRPEAEPAFLEPSAFAMERMLNKIHRLLQGQKFSSIGEANAFLASLTASGVTDAPDPGGDDARSRAQDLAYQAMEAESEPEIAALCRQALALDPDCVDALATLAHVTHPSEQAYISKLQEAVAAGARGLGKEFFENNRGHFWGILETRPYMRARFDLGMALLSAGRAAEATSHLEALLDLNPEDNQGVRDVLLSYYLLAKNLSGARSLLKRYEGDSSALFAWGTVLESFLSGRREEASRALPKARETNQYVEKYFTGERPAPAELPDFYSPGQESEAEQCAFFLCKAWQHGNGAAQWLAAQTQKSGRAE
jgi:tetratricopeptide (TPR) repeat protein